VLEADLGVGRQRLANQRQVGERQLDRDVHREQVLLDAAALEIGQHRIGEIDHEPVGQVLRHAR